MFNSELEAQQELNEYYQQSLLELLGGINNSIESKKIQSFALLQGKKIKTYYALVTTGVFVREGIQLNNKEFICKCINDSQSLYIIYTSNGLIPKIKDVYIIDNLSSKIHI